MGFDDLARHMASRDNKRVKVAGNADQIVADAAVADRRMSRTRNLILGPILLIGGLVVVALYLLYLKDATDPTPDPQRPPETGGGRIHGEWILAAGIVAFGAGARQTYRGLRG